MPRVIAEWPGFRVVVFDNDADKPKINGFDLSYIGDIAYIVEESHENAMGDVSWGKALIEFNVINKLVEALYKGELSYPMEGDL